MKSPLAKAPGVKQFRRDDTILHLETKGLWGRVLDYKTQERKVAQHL